jgi:four helix bundle protein
MAYRPIEETEVYQRASTVSDRIYGLVARWTIFPQQTVGQQLVRAADSIAANLVEGDGRGSDVDSVRFFRYARGSARETVHFLARARERGLLEPEEALTIIDEVDQCRRMINGLISFRNDEGYGRRVREEMASYDASL